MVLSTNIVPSRTLKKVAIDAMSRELHKAVAISLEENNLAYHLSVQPPHDEARVDALNEFMMREHTGKYMKR
jgi:hypothetical protein